MPHRQSTFVEVRYTKGRGRGVFATCAIAKETIIERVPVLVLPAAEILEAGNGTPMLSHYVFDWGKGTVALALGFGSLYNHSFNPNAFYQDCGRQTKEYVALRDIDAGEEITINYNGKPEDQTPMPFRVLD